MVVEVVVGVVVVIVDFIEVVMGVGVVMEGVFFKRKFKMFGSGYWGSFF